MPKGKRAVSAQEPPAQEPEIEEPLPSGAREEEAPQEETTEKPATKAAPVTPSREYVVPDGPASFGPVVMNGRRIHARSGVVYHVPSAEERADVLATGRFRGASPADLKKAGRCSAGEGGPVTRESLPPGALKGELT